MSFLHNGSKFLFSSSSFFIFFFFFKSFGSSVADLIWTSSGDQCQVETCCADGFVSLRVFFFFFWAKNCYRPKLIGIGWNDPKLSRIGPEGKWVVLSFQIASGMKYSYHSRWNGTDLITLVLMDKSINIH